MPIELKLLTIAAIAGCGLSHLEREGRSHGHGHSGHGFRRDGQRPR
jgi:hypothetical protein